LNFRRKTNEKCVYEEKKILFTEFVYYAAEAFAHTKTPDKKNYSKRYSIM